MNTRILLLALPALAASAFARPPEIGQPLPPWRDGELDIHHINTGRGDALFFILPDGTTLLEDASGKTVEAPPFSLPSRPDASRPPGEWVARYVQRVLPRGHGGIDYALLSHFHGDHMGAITADSPLAANGAYRLSGITQVAESVPIATILDRGWPHYDFPAPIRNATLDNYRRFLDWQIRHRGLKVERFAPGRNDQIALLHAAGNYPGFQIRNLYGNGRVWTGQGNATRDLFPPLHTLGKDQQPIENILSNAFVIRYGRFDYFSGGDLSDERVALPDGDGAWQQVERPVAEAAGPVDAMKANHHGSWDANSAAFLAALRPRVIVVTTRAEGHPAVNTWHRLTSKALWPGERDIFVTHVSEATARTTYGIERQARSTQGHVVIRTAPGGDSYRVFVLDDGDERMRVKAVFGPYPAQ
ncbi:MAG: ComEC/Rec2 family competence protein [Stenotrophomonas acidaminiphila]